MSQKNVRGGVEPLADFYWPEFNSDSKRIKLYSKVYKDMSISEAFAEHYNLTFKPVSEMVNQIPKDLRVGDIISTRIRAIEKGRVTFDTGNIKANVQSGVNLYRYEKLRHFLPMDEIKAVVTRVDKDKVVIDPLTPMIEDWLSPILKDTTSQKVIPNPETGATYKSIKVKDLQLTNGGFTGKAVIPSVSEFVGEDYVMEAFIPGSQIVLNITDNFEQFNGRTVDAFVMNYMSKPGYMNKQGSRNEMSLICSAKEVIKFRGELNMISLFKAWCEDNNVWQSVADMTFEGKVTGVLGHSTKSAKKCGVFIEIPELSITGMVATKPEELVNYKPHAAVKVKLTGFDEETYFDYATQQVQHVLPYEIEDGVLKKCNLKPILQFA